MNAILAMSQFIFLLITFPYVCRILLPVGIGKVSFATSMVSYFTMFAQLGIPTYGIRTCGKVRDNKEELTRTAQELFIINFVMSALAYSVFFIALWTVPRLRQDKILFLIVSTTILLFPFIFFFFHNLLHFFIRTLCYSICTYKYKRN